MTKLTISLMMLMLSMMMYFLNHPLSMGFMILMQTLLTCLLSGMLIKTYWFSYILFLTFLGGLLVLFIYICSIASNEMFIMSNNLKMIFILFMLMLPMILMMSNKNLNWMNLNNNLEMNNFMNFMFFNNENKINMNKLYNNYSSMLTMLLIIYLFITLIAIVKITNIFYGPLRMSFN
uniref:NADH-ubiquinone oxidoreductase chain 6 n=1 Tax=Protambulyx astygonus TaxID=1088141 RepID=A0A6G6D836_9NEOP|nr:NADH dehydrogenase subunit 6 [Protambulyx astygonus]QIE12693.1 NADH dehydrogenase subunit 6 [Protambulyx astygonus]